MADLVRREGWGTLAFDGRINGKMKDACRRIKVCPTLETFAEAL